MKTDENSLLSLLSFPFSVQLISAYFSLFLRFCVSVPEKSGRPHILVRLQLVSDAHTDALTFVPETQRVSCELLQNVEVRACQRKT